MKRLVLEVFLLIALAAVGPYAWYLHTKVGADTAKVQTMTERGEEATKKLEEVSQALEAAQKELEPLRLQAQQMQAVRAGLANRVTIKDLEAAYAKEKTLTPERHLGVGVLRLLSTGQADEATLQSIKKALDAADWGSPSRSFAPLKMRWRLRARRSRCSTNAGPSCPSRWPRKRLRRNKPAQSLRGRRSPLGAPPDSALGTPISLRQRE